MIQAGLPARREPGERWGVSRNSCEYASSRWRHIAYDLRITAGVAEAGYLDDTTRCSPTETRHTPREGRTSLEAWWLAATNRWLTAADAYVARYPTKLAFCSRFRRQRKESAKLSSRYFSLASMRFLLPKPATQNIVPTKQKKAGGHRPPALAKRSETYLISAFAPASSNFFFASSAAAFGTASLTGFGAPSTRSFASFRPRPVNSRTALITDTLFAPISTRFTVNSVCSSTTAAAPAGPATATAAADTPNFSSNALTSSFNSRTDIELTASRMSSFAIAI